MSDLEQAIERIVRDFDGLAGRNCGHLYGGWCYVVSSSAEHIKIGATRTSTVERLVGRIREIQALCPTPLCLLRLFTGGRQRERTLHRRLAKYRMHGEWFSSIAISELPFSGCLDCDLVVMPGGIHPDDLALLRGEQ